MGTHPIFESDFDCLTECWLEGFFPFQCDSPRLRLVSHHRLSATSTRRRTASVSTRTARLILLPSPKWLPSAMKPPMLLLSRTSTAGSSTSLRLRFLELKSTKLDERRRLCTTLSRSRAPG